MRHMKRRLMCLTYLLLLALTVHTGYSIWSSWYDVSASFKNGYEDAMQGSGASTLSNERMFELVLHQSEEGSALLNQVVNSKTGEEVTVEVTRMHAFIPKESLVSITWISKLIAVIIFCLFIIITVLFLTLMNSIRNAIIFTPLNIKQLRYIGSGLFLSGILYAVIGYMEADSIRSTFELTGYHIAVADTIDFTLFTNGLIAFLVAEVFAIGLKLEEEQELTI